MRTLVSLVVLCLLQPSIALQSEKPVAKAKEGELVYPTFEPFESARMFKLMVGDPATLDFEKKAEEIAEVAKAMKAGKEAGEKVGGGKPAGQSALLEPALSDLVRAQYPLLPGAMMKLAPLWKSKTWSAEQVTAAQGVAAFVKTLPDGPTLTFANAADAENQRQLESLVRWYRTQIAKPERYAAMIPTMDDGPYSGLPYESKTPLEAVQTQKLGDVIELHLCKVDRPKEPWVLQAVKDKKVVWTRVLSGGPDESLVDAKLRSEPQKLGEYGWKVFVGVHWSMGAESAYVYLDRDGKLLFYFLTW